MLVMDADGDALLMDGDVAGDVGMFMFIGEPLKPMERMLGQGGCWQYLTGTSGNARGWAEAG